MRGDFLVVLDRLLPLMGRDGATFLTRVNSTPSPPDYKAISQTFVDRHGIARAWSEFLAQYAGNGNARSPRPLWFGGNVRSWRECAQAPRRLLAVRRVSGARRVVGAHSHSSMCAFAQSDLPAPRRSHCPALVASIVICGNVPCPYRKSHPLAREVESGDSRNRSVRRAILPADQIGSFLMNIEAIDASARHPAELERLLAEVAAKPNSGVPRR